MIAAPEPLCAIAGVEGWLSEEQARVLSRHAGAVAPPARIVEIGSYRGRSTIVLAGSAPEGVEVVAIDPHAGNDRGPQQIHGTREEGEADRQAFEANLAAARVRERVAHLRMPAGAAASQLSGRVALLYVDGAHRYRAARADLVGWGARVAPGGTMLIHDAFSSVGVTLAILTALLFGRDFVYIGRTRSLAEYRRADAPLRGTARTRNALRQLAELPWFARNLVIKLALVARVHPLALALGHRPEDPWPY